MNTVTSTELRTKAAKIIQILTQGGSVDVIHRSKVIGEIRPKKKSEPKVFNAKHALKLLKKMNLPYLSYEEREKRYREHMEKKYGKGIS